MPLRNCLPALRRNSHLSAPVLVKFIITPVDYAPDATNKPPARRDQLIALKLVQEFIIKPSLRTVPGLAEVNAIGGFEKQIVIEPKFEKLNAANLSFEELAHAIRDNLENAGGGTVSRESEQVVLRGLGRAQTMEEIADLPVKMAGALEPLLVRDVADVAVWYALPHRCRSSQR